jgi:alpha-glucuronidase
MRDGATGHSGPGRRSVLAAGLSAVAAPAVLPSGRTRRAAAAAGAISRSGGTGPAIPGVTILTPRAAAYIDSRASGTNYSGSTQLWVSRGQQMTFLRFDAVSGAASGGSSAGSTAGAAGPGRSVGAAKLRFFASGRAGSFTYWPLMIYGISGQPWSEETITWDQSPRFEGDWLELVDGSDLDGILGQGWYEADVTDYVNRCLAGRAPVSFRIESEAGKDKQLAFSSPAAGTNQPQLVLWPAGQAGSGQPSPAAGDDGSQLWLRYPMLTGPALVHVRRFARGVLVQPGGQPSAVLRAAAAELRRGLSGLAGTQVPVSGQPGGSGPVSDGTVVVGTTGGSPLVRDLLRQAGLLDEATRRGAEGFVLASVRSGGGRVIVAGSAGDQGAQYGAFRLLQLAQLGTGLATLSVADAPAVRYRMFDHWDDYASNNPVDGWDMIERGYAGHSLWEMDRPASSMLGRYAQYARACASVGINGALLNDVNATIDWIEDQNLPRVAAIADALRPYGVRVYLSLNFASPILIGGLPTADPLEPAVREWWRGTVETIYRLIPDFGGFCVKGDAEGEPGPVQYGRTPADGANMFAALVQPHGGIVLWRAFVYGPALAKIGITDPDRAKQAYELFRPEDGTFAENVILQVKNSVWDFQPHEPVNPLIGGMPRTNTGIELALSKEYEGHTTHVNYQVAEFERILAFDTYANGPGTLVRDVLDGTAFGYTRTLITSVATFGTDTDWMRHPLDQANWYGFGRIAWDPAASAAELARQWATLALTADENAAATIGSLLMDSERAYAQFAEPIGLPWTVSLTYHFKNDVSAADATNGVTSTGIGYDRTQATGSGFTGQYAAQAAAAYESLATTPAELVLFLHHLAWDQVLPQTGETVIQSIYDLTFAGTDAVPGLIRQWDSVRGSVDGGRWRKVSRLLQRQLSEAVNYRNVTAMYFSGRSGIGDNRGRSAALRQPAASLATQTAAPGAPVQGATSSDPGHVYLVPVNWAGTGRWEREARLQLAADQQFGTSAAVTAAGAGASLRAPRQPGRYHLYAVSDYGTVSAPSAGSVTVTAG